MQTILTIDDESFILNMYRLILQKEGFNVLTASRATKALDLLETNKVDLIISDFMMPEMNGYTLILLLKANENWKNIPVILLTANYEQVDFEYPSIRQQVAAFLAKPISSLELKDIVKKVLSNL